MLTKVQIGEALKTLRVRAGFEKEGQFTKASGIHFGTIANTEGGVTMPSIEIIERWVLACHGSLSEFFAELEGRKGEELRVAPRDKELVKEFLDAIRVKKVRDQLESFIAYAVQRYGGGDG